MKCQIFISFFFDGSEEFSDSDHNTTAIPAREANIENILSSKAAIATQYIGNYVERQKTTVFALRIIPTLGR